MPKPGDRRALLAQPTALRAELPGDDGAPTGGIDAGPAPAIKTS
jgi:hypothetical protein